MEKTEEWRLIPGVPHYYVSNLGNIKREEYKYIDKTGRTLTAKERIVTVSPNNRGYLRFHTIGENKKYRFVHRAVAMAFIENPNNYPFINHLDCNPLNNSVENLEWCTHLQNMQYMSKLGRNVRTKEWLDKLHETQKETYKAVVGISQDGKIVEFDSVNHTASAGFSPSCITSCCSGKRVQHKGFKWFYKTELARVLWNQ